jgi:hypothetical protein
MIQDILVILIIAATLINLLFKIKKVWKQQKVSGTCRGCSQCDVKKSLIRHEQS